MALVGTLTLLAALIPMRYVGHTWNEQDVVECQASAFVGQAARGGEPATEAAMKECVVHRRGKRWGPWGAFSNATMEASTTAPTTSCSSSPQHRGTPA
jgi:hypothetical protein